MQQELPTRRDLLERLESKITETRCALIDAAAAAGLQPDQEAVYRRLLAAVDELLSRIRTALANTPADSMTSRHGSGTDQP